MPSQLQQTVQFSSQTTITTASIAQQLVSSLDGSLLLISSLDLSLCLISLLAAAFRISISCRSRLSRIFCLAAATFSLALNVTMAIRGHLKTRIRARQPRRTLAFVSLLMSMATREKNIGFKKLCEVVSACR